MLGIAHRQSKYSFERKREMSRGLTCVSPLATVSMEYNGSAANHFWFVATCLIRFAATC